MKKAVLALSLTFAFWLLSSDLGWACSSCMKNASGPLIDSARAGVLMMVGVVFVMMIGFASFFIFLRKRAQTGGQSESGERPDLDRSVRE